MVNQPDQDKQGVHTPVRKLVLPEPPDAGQQRRRYSSPWPGQSISQAASTASHGLFTRTWRRMRTEPAFALLSLAIAFVLVASVIFVAFGAFALLGGSGGPTWTSAMVQHPTMPTATGTIDMRPKFPTPGSKKGSSASSQPGAGPTPSLQPTATNTDDQGTLSVQFTNLPDVVNNQTRVQVQVQTSEPDVDVRLQVTYDAAPFYYTSSARVTNGNGNSTLTWNVRIYSFSHGNNAQATVVVTATDRNGQQATSQPSTVEVTP